MNKITHLIMLEKTIEKKIVDYCKTYNILQQKLLGKKGMPDRIFYLPGGRITFIEFKQTGESLKQLQKIRHVELEHLGFTVYICRNYEDGIEFLQTELGEL